MPRRSPRTRFAHRYTRPGVRHLDSPSRSRRIAESRDEPFATLTFHRGPLDTKSSFQDLAYSHSGNHPRAVGYVATEREDIVAIQRRLQRRGDMAASL